MADIKGATFVVNSDALPTVQALKGSATWDPGSMAAGTAALTKTSKTVTVTGAAVGDPVFAGFSKALTSGTTLSAWVSAADTVTVEMINTTNAVINLSSGTLSVIVFKI